MDKNIISRNGLLAQKLIKNLESRHFEAFYCEDKESALQKAAELIGENDTVAWGGSMTLDELGVKQFLEKRGNTLINRDVAKTEEERKEAMIKSFSANAFLMSANAISENGEIVNVDGHGTRICSLCFGPDKVILFVGMNKVVKTVEDAISRARNIAAPINAQRIAGLFGIETPCVKTGSCADCKSPMSICSQILVTRLSYPAKRIKVILINENLGY